MAIAHSSRTRPGVVRLTPLCGVDRTSLKQPGGRCAFSLGATWSPAVRELQAARSIAAGMKSVATFPRLFGPRIPAGARSERKIRTYIGR